MMTTSTPVNILMILDGWGINPNIQGNAVALAKTPFLDYLLNNAPHCKLSCSGNAVGLPEGTMGNSEVGHMNIGAGRRVLQDLVQINTAIKDRTFFENLTLTRAMDLAVEKGASLHLIGLLSDGGVHSHISHLFTLMDMARFRKVARLYIHPILDGRDTSPTSGINFIKQVENHIIKHRYGTIADLMGRYWAMDRDVRWDRVQKAYDMLTLGKGQLVSNALKALEDSYANNETDEFIAPTIINPDGIVKDGDIMIFFNFRADRAKEITRSFTQDDFDGFLRTRTPKLQQFVCMTRYDKTFDLPVAFERKKLTDVLGQVLSFNKIPQLRIAETEKYAHVTYFFNGGMEVVFEGEERILIPSPRDVPTYDQKPSMSAFELTDKACQAIESGRFQFIVLNFANMDMVGHTGVLDAAVQACETVDTCVERVVRTIWKTKGTAFITADHGNSEQMISDDDCSPHTAHTTNPVFFIIATQPFKNIKLKNGIIGDVAPTILKIMNIAQPSEMTGTSLIEN